MKKIFVTILLVLLVSPLIYADGLWNINGHIFSNVNTLQRGKKVKVSGRVSSGPMKTPLQILIHIKNDEGRIYEAYTIIPNYIGKSETFETYFNAWTRSRQWKVVSIQTN
ncbi:MAG: hypothetical protein RBR42_04485 [Desulfomicrobium sp.]|jgi:hypothetical protein|nr:hypothetical protein [Desulfomicrobium sp.]NLV97323.1 hypothetical protein [Desulfovibrionales bacterium]